MRPMRPMRVMRRRREIAVVLSMLAVGAAAGCHVVSQREVMRPFAIERIPRRDAAIARRPAVVWTEAGRLRFVEPLVCPTDEIVVRRTTLETATRPNLATFTVGAIASAIGGILLTSGLFSDHPGSNPITYTGATSAGVGLALAVGPWIGDRTEVTEIASRARGASSLRRPGPHEPCGQRPLPAMSATLAIAGIDVHGAIDDDGVFAISPYQWVDAYAAASAGSSAVTASVATPGGPRVVETVLDAAALAKHAADYLAHADFEPRIEPLKLVPGIVAGTPRASLIVSDAGLAIRVVLPLRNDGPGDAWAVRGQITAPAVPAIDGRMIYVGALASGAAVSRELVIPIALATALRLRGTTIEPSIELRDAHGTAPSTPVRFRDMLTSKPSR